MTSVFGARRKIVTTHKKRPYTACQSITLAPGKRINSRVGLSLFLERGYKNLRTFLLCDNCGIAEVDHPER